MYKVQNNQRILKPFPHTVDLNLQSKLIDVWHNNNIPEFYENLFFRYIKMLPSNEAEIYIKQQIKSIEKQTTFIQLFSRAMSEKSKVVESITKLLQKYKGNNPSILKHLCELINKIRQLNYKATFFLSRIRQVYEPNLDISQSSQKYYFNQFATSLDKFRFQLFKSPLTKYIAWIEEYDPFLISVKIVNCEKNSQEYEFLRDLFELHIEDSYRFLKMKKILISWLFLHQVIKNSKQINNLNNYEERACKYIPFSGIKEELIKQRSIQLQKLKKYENNDYLPLISQPNHKQKAASSMQITNPSDDYGRTRNYKFTSISRNQQPIIIKEQDYSSDIRAYTIQSQSLPHRALRRNSDEAGRIKRSRIRQLTKDIGNQFKYRQQISEIYTENSSKKIQPQLDVIYTSSPTKSTDLPIPKSPKLEIASSIEKSKAISRKFQKELLINIMISPLRQKKQIQNPICRTRTFFDGEEQPLQKSKNDEKDKMTVTKKIEKQLRTNNHQPMNSFPKDQTVISKKKPQQQKIQIIEKRINIQKAQQPDNLDKTVQNTSNKQEKAKSIAPNSEVKLLSGQSNIKSSISQQKRQIKMKIGRFTFSQFSTYINSYDMNQTYKLAFDWSRVIKQTQIQQTYVTQFLIDGQPGALALGSLVPPLNHFAIRLWVIHKSTETKLASVLFSKYLQFVQKSITSPIIYYKGQELKEIVNSGFELKKQKLYSRARKTPPRQIQRQFEKFVYCECSHLSFPQVQRQAIFYSEEIQKFNKNNALAATFFFLPQQQGIPSSIVQQIKLDRDLKHISEANKLLQSEGFDLYGVNKGLNITSIDLLRFVYNSQIKDPFTACDGYFKLYGSQILNQDPTFLFSINLTKNNGKIYFGKGFTTIEQFANSTKSPPSKRSNFRVPMFSKTLYGKYDKISSQGKGFYGNWQFTFVWEDQMQGRIKHQTQNCFSFNQQSYYLGIQIEKSLIYSIKIVEDDLIL